jgi:hypothetical protein
MDLFRVGVSVMVGGNVASVMSAMAAQTLRAESAVTRLNQRFRDLARTQELAAGSFRRNSEIMEASMARRAHMMDARVDGARGDVATPFDYEGMARIQQLEQDRGEVMRANALQQEQFQARESLSERATHQQERTATAAGA